MKWRPELVIFDVDGVLVDVRGSFHRSTLQTVRHFTGQRVLVADLHRWKARSGYNDDWRLTTEWIASLGFRVPYSQVKRQFQKFYWGADGHRGNVERERWLVPIGMLQRWARKAELALFTGRTRHELLYTLKRVGVQRCFRKIIAMDDVRRRKPHPEGLLRILAGREPGCALYLGDNIDDALAARACGMPFVAILARGSTSGRLGRASFQELGALEILGDVKGINAWLK